MKTSLETKIQSARQVIAGLDELLEDHKASMTPEASFLAKTMTDSFKEYDTSSRKVGNVFRIASKLLLAATILAIASSNRDPELLRQIILPGVGSGIVSGITFAMKTKLRHDLGSAVDLMYKTEKTRQFYEGIKAYPYLKKASNANAAKAILQSLFPDVLGRVK